MVSRIDYALPAAADAGRAKQAVALVIPAAVPLTMAGTFYLSNTIFGAMPGYLIGFLVYWGVWCLAVPLFLLGPRKVRDLFAASGRRLTRRSWLVAGLVLLFPPLGAIATRFLPEVGTATLAMGATALAVAVVNATMEELLWRGVYISYWPDDWRLGVVYPAVGFGLWHLAPQIVHPGANPLGFALGSIVIGLCWGWVAYRTRSLRLPIISHILTDGSGLRSAAFFLPH
jgi:membrane protease YdiL (CAAX protease family)